MIKKLVLVLVALLISSPAYAARGLQGTGDAANGAADQTLISAQGAGKTIRLQKGFCSVNVAAAGGGGEVALEDGVGGTRLITADADAVGTFSFDFSPSGYALTTNTLLNLTVDGAATTQATADCTVTATV